MHHGNAPPQTDWFARHQPWAWAALAALLFVPRLIRMAHPQIWIEDESYLTAARAMSHGLLPYRDVPLPHYPILEAMLASVFRVAHASVRAAEVTTQLAALAGSVLIFALGRRLDGLLTGAAAATIFATSGLLFRYHLFEREVFIVVPVLAAVLLATTSGQRSAMPVGAHRLVSDRSAKAFAPRHAAGIGVLLFIALTIKLTAVAALVAIGVQLAYERGRRPAVRAIALAVSLLAVLTATLAAAFGADFIVQVFLFRVLHASFPSLAAKLTEMRLTMDVSLACGAAGTALILWTGQTRRWAGPLLQLASGLVFLVLLNPTYWAHTGIELLPWLSLSGGFLVASLVRAIRIALKQRGERRQAPGKTVACALAAVGLLIFVAPIHNLNWQAGDGSTYGFGYRDRAEIERVGAYVRDHTDSGALVATPPIIALAADRRELVPYPEIAGTIEEITDVVRRRGYLAALRDPGLRHDSFWESVEASRARIAPHITSALNDHRIAALVNDAPDDLMPVLFVQESAATLTANGYQPASAFAHYEVWLPR